jgi:hypothetical protein
LNAKNGVVIFCRLPALIGVRQPLNYFRFEQAGLSAIIY